MKIKYLVIPMLVSAIAMNSHAQTAGKTVPVKSKTSKTNSVKPVSTTGVKTV